MRLGSGAARLRQGRRAAFCDLWYDADGFGGTENDQRGRAVYGLSPRHSRAWLVPLPSILTTCALLMDSGGEKVASDESRMMQTGG